MIVGLGNKNKSQRVSHVYSRVSKCFFFYLYSMLANADMNEFYAEHARPGGWNGISSKRRYVFENIYDEWCVTLLLVCRS